MPFSSPNRRVLIPPVPHYVLRRARIPACLLAPGGAARRLTPDRHGLVLADIEIQGGRVLGVEATGAWIQGASTDLGGAMVWPCFVDLHTHLDKGHIWPRRENPDGSFGGALGAVTADRRANWSAEDVAARFDFSLACAYAHGTKAVRTHLDSAAPQDEISWAVFSDLRAEWAGRVTVQAVSLVMIDELDDPVFARRLIRRVADHGGVLGAVTTVAHGSDDQVDRLFGMAADAGLDLDLHVDETLDPEARTLGLIAETATRRDFRGKIVVGHCCSLSAQPEGVIARTLDAVAAAPITVVSLPMCNMYLQDRGAARTPRHRGVTLLHEMASRGIPVAVASDNCRDPFYAYGDHDMWEVFREAARIAHLDHPVGVWPRAATVTPAAVMGVEAGLIGPGLPADLVIFAGRSWSEVMARPEAGRVVLRQGRPIDTNPPAYEKLDAILEGATP